MSEPQVLTDDFFNVSQLELIENLSGLGCNVSDICHIIGVSRATFYRRMALFPIIAETLERGKSKAKAKLLNTLYQMASMQDMRALAFALTMIYGVGRSVGADAFQDDGRTVEELENELEIIERRKACLAKIPQI